MYIKYSPKLSQIMKMAMLLKQMEVNSEKMLTKTQTEVLIICSLVTKEFINVKKNPQR